MDGVLLIAVRDDGIGGADPARGSGLVGLRDRIDALGGTIFLRSKSEGTAVEITLPLGDDRQAGDNLHRAPLAGASGSTAMKDGHHCSRHVAAELRRRLIPRNGAREKVASA